MRREDVSGETLAPGDNQIGPADPPSPPPPPETQTFSFKPYEGISAFAGRNKRTCDGQRATRTFTGGRYEDDNHHHHLHRDDDDDDDERQESSDNLSRSSVGRHKHSDKFANLTCECRNCQPTVGGSGTFQHHEDNGLASKVNKQRQQEFKFHSRQRRSISSSIASLSNNNSNNNNYDNSIGDTTMQSTHSLSMQLNGQVNPIGLVGVAMSPQSPSSPLGDNSSFGAAVNQQPMGDSMGQLEAAALASSLQGGSVFVGSSSKLGRLVGKKASRFKELVLQNLGRAERTHDELFSIYEDNFYKQQAQATKLQKEFKIYVSSLKGAHEANRSLNVCIQQATGDYQSARHDLVCENLSQLEHLSDDLMEKLRDQILVSISEYLSQFGELREKISKRRRKLIDYDSSRRNYELALANITKKRMRQQEQQQQQQNPDQHQPTGGSLRTLRSALMLSNSMGDVSSSQQQQQQHQQQHGLPTSHLVDEARLLKLREQYNFSKIMYETINSELHEELPMVYEKKMKHLLMTLQNYFSLEAQFSSNAGKLFATISDVVDELPTIVGHLRHHHLNDSHHHRHMHRDDELEHHGRDHNVNGKLADQQKGDHSGQVVVGAGGSSGMGSSRGDSSVGSSSSSSPIREVAEVDVHRQVANNAQSDSDSEQSEDSDECNCEPVDCPDVDSGDQQLAAAEVVEGSAAAAEKEHAEPKVAEVKNAEVDEPKVTDTSEKAHEPVGGQQIAQGQQHVSSPGASEERAAEISVAKKSDQNDSEEKPAELIEGETVNSIALVGPAIAEVVDDATPISAIDMNSNCLYKVRTNYKYLAEDADELCFEAEEVIQVIPFEPHQEQEEGWLMGVREFNGQRGLFPANFTRPV